MAAKRKRKRQAWVRMGPEPYLATCDRCGGHVEKPPIPCPLDAFVIYLDFAVSLHAHCEVPA